ncbi:hypothetical protein CIRG_09224 [Coccidioides immitis RMSCC 2394]|uniref:Uncharacterized protein n=1 Tax=Coccidioides immitis RMSCC 2394 TaxID=404692 RepID=A0A0J6YMT5_COCIT|nr:hypothetical protein CIRG_09224 [Coccidioides immitis RMSCC 2394]
MYPLDTRCCQVYLLILSNGSVNVVQGPQLITPTGERGTSTEQVILPQHGNRICTLLDSNVVRLILSVAMAVPSPYFSWAPALSISDQICEEGGGEGIIGDTERLYTRNIFAQNGDDAQL